MHYAIIMAGGAGTRLWPMSRRNRPKQLLELIDGRCLMELAVERLYESFPPENILVITNAEYANLVHETLPKLPQENIIGEPMGRDTAAAVALGAQIISARDADSVMAVFTADHVIKPEDVFCKTVMHAAAAAEKNPHTLFTLGIAPTSPHTGYGYVQRGREIEPGVFEVSAFKEKPDADAAKKYFESGEFFWNSGMFVWKTSAILSAFAKSLPQTSEKLAPVADAVKNGEDFTELLADVYPKLEKISIDYAIMEKAGRVAMVELPCTWLDVGSWPSLEDVLGTDADGNVSAATNVITLDARGNVIVSDDDEHLIAVLGVDDCVIVRTPDATLVCRKDDAQRIKELVAMVQDAHGKKYV